MRAGAGVGKSSSTPTPESGVTANSCSSCSPRTAQLLQLRTVVDRYRHNSMQMFTACSDPWCSIGRVNHRDCAHLSTGWRTAAAPTPEDRPGYEPAYTWAERFECSERIYLIRETNRKLDSCNSCKRLVPSRLQELHESKFCFFSRIEFIRSKLEFSSRIYIVELWHRSVRSVKIYVKSFRLPSWPQMTSEKVTSG